MKKVLRIFSILFCLLMTTAVFTSCSNDTDPADVDLFVGTYKGHIGYTNIKPANNRPSHIYCGLISLIKRSACPHLSIM